MSKHTDPRQDETNIIRNIVFSSTIRKKTFRKHCDDGLKSFIQKQ